MTFESIKTYVMGFFKTQPFIAGGICFAVGAIFF